MRGLLVAALLLGACSNELGAGKSGVPSDMNPGGNSGGTSGGGDYKPPSVDGGVPAEPTSDASAMGGGCATLIPVSAPSFSDLPAAPGSKLRVRVQSGTVTTPWTWTVNYGDGVGTDVPVTALDPPATEVEFPIEKPGRYQITATSAGSACGTTALASATAADQRLGHFRIRIAPPPGAFPVQEVPVQAMAGVPVAQTVIVRQGQPVTFQPQDELGTHGIASYVRVTQLGSSLAVEGHTGRADFKPALLATFNYDVLFVPDDEIAPFVALGLTPIALNVLSQKLSPGAPLTGALRDGTGAPLKDGRVILRSGALTSTVGKSTDAGDFALRVRAGQFAITASPDPASGLPELSLPADTGLTVANDTAAATLNLTWSPVALAPVGLVVRAADGVTPAAGARVQLERTTAMGGAGTRAYTPASGGAVVRMLPGTIRLSAQAGADGGVSFPRVPPGSYRLLVTPADTDHASALTASALDVPGAGVAGQMVRLAATVKLRGTLLPAAAAGARVYATPREPDPPRPVTSATVATDGSYQLDVDPMRSYVVWADPGLGKPLARTQLAIVDAGATGATVPQRTLPRALPFTGTLAGEGATKIGGAVIQIFCDPAAASCLDPTLTLGEGVTDRNGGFALTLPDPGSF